MFRISTTVITVLVADLLASSGDITSTWTSPMYPKLYSNDTTVNPLGRPITEDEDSWMGSLINIGAILGALPAGLVADRYGRKKTLIAVAVPHITAYLIYAFATNVYMFYAGRLVNGVSVGVGYAILPMYIAEVSEDSQRSTLSSTLNIFWSVGNFVPYAVGPYLSVRWFNLVLIVFPVSFMVLFMFLGYETPHFLVHKGREVEAVAVLTKLRKISVGSSKKEVKALQVAFSEHQDGQWSDIVRDKTLRKALIISVSLVVLQQFSGINAVLYYLQPIFEASGTQLSVPMCSNIFGFCLLLFSFFTALIVKHTGVKWLMGVSAFGSGLSLSLLGAFFYIKDCTNMGTESIFWLPIAGLIGYIFFYVIGFGSLPWTISSELFPNSVKAISAAAVAASCYLSAFIVTKFFNYLNGSVHRAGTFWLFSGLSWVALLVTVVWVPETKGKSFQEIQDMLKK
ncbi:facilitated trehalose transporter Tret1-like [Anthonomus grandis grandis]|uniref:facilitated trehalose transporter Tret1-like n=1 Tax=Anthonomus grandis grandis TaxID=2921223 RepID=UPI0021663CC6|nr:facilitated trehalose transporter Tret1-like [Anthonomus grandis grandis]